MEIRKEMNWREWYALFDERGGGCDEGRRWVSALPDEASCEEMLVRASGDPEFKAAWAAWGLAAFCGELDARLRGLLFALLKREPMLAALLYRDHGARFGDVDRKRCLMAFHSGFRADGAHVLPRVEQEIGVMHG